MNTRYVKLLRRRLMTRGDDRHVAELHVHIAVLNGYTTLGIPVGEPVGWVCPGEGEALVSA